MVDSFKAAAAFTAYCGLVSLVAAHQNLHEVGNFSLCFGAMVKAHS